MLFGAISRKVALRVDASGITLGGHPLRYKATTVLVPWSDIIRVVMWGHHGSFRSKMQWIGLERRESAPDIHGGGRTGRRMVQAIVPHGPAELYLAGRAVNGWSLDREKLTDAVRRFAPSVEVIDAG